MILLMLFVPTLNTMLAGLPGDISYLAAGRRLFVDD
jgi:hypothetical protein